MRTLALLGTLLATAPWSLAGEARVNGRAFTVPEGFEVELAAGPPLVDRPIVAAFDEQGRLYVADSSGSNDPVQKQLAEKPHRILRLEDNDGDGRFDRRTVFADKMMFPEGAMWRDGSLYVAAPPSIWKLTDTDGDGVADHREEWFQGKTLTGCANDLHGPYPGPDGCIYWCKGAFAQQTYERLGPPLVTRAAHVFRAWPGGTGIEPVITGGMDNPVDVVFTPGGEPIVSATFLVHPGGGLRDGLIHAVYGGVYGKVHDVLEGHKRTGPDVMPVLSHLGPAAPCGLTRYESDVFGKDYQDNLFACLFNMHKVTRHVLTPSGATFASKDEDFLVSSDLDFHPTDVLEDADGSLLVIDTGGWYKLCCPTSQFHRPDVLGAIYRIRKKSAPKVEDPRGLKLAWDLMPPLILVKLLDDPRPAVRARAIEAFPWQNPTLALVELENIARGIAQAIIDQKPVATSPLLRRNVVWAAARFPQPEARRIAYWALHDRDETVFQAAAHSAGLWRDRDVVKELERRLCSESPPVRRAAAEALGRIGDRSAVPDLLKAAGLFLNRDDRVVQHSIIYALIEIADPNRTAIGLKSPDPEIRRAALIALDQMDGGGLTPETVAPLLASNRKRIRETASWIVSRHPEWGEALAGTLRERLGAPDLSPDDRAELEGQLARLARSPAVQELLAATLADGNAPPEAKLTALRAIARSGVKDVPGTWVDGIVRSLAVPELSRQAIATARALNIPKDRAEELGAGLVKAGEDEHNPSDLRLEALAAVPGGLKRVPERLFTFLRHQLEQDRPVAERLAAADVLAKAKLTRDQLIALTGLLGTVGPLDLDRLLGAFEQSTDEDVGMKLVEALKAAPSLTALSAGALRPRLAKFGPKVQEAAEAIYTKLNVDAAHQRETLERLLATLPAGDVRRGQAVFHGARAACVSCHAIGYLGGKVGPDLTRIGQVRTDRDLLESIVFPSASFVRSFEPVVVATKDGKVFSGVPRRDAPDEVVLATGPTDEARIARGDIEEVRPGTVSVMPAGLDRQLTPQELADLIAFLKACR